MEDGRFRRWALVLAVVGALHAALYLPIVSPHETYDTPSYTEAAHALLHGGYSTPLPAIDITAYRIPQAAQGALERDTFRSPGYPLFLALLGGGVSDVSRASVFAFQTLLMGLAVWLVAAAARAAFGARVALAGAAAYALDPWSKRYAALILSEQLATALACGAVLCAVVAWRRRSLGSWTVCGLLCAALTLTRPAFALAIPLVALAALLTLRRWTALAPLAASLALLAPWVAWEADVTGRLTLGSFGEGWNLLLAAHGEGVGRTLKEIQRDVDYQRDFVAPHRFAPSAQELLRNPDAHGRYLARADADLRDRASDLYRERLRDEPHEVLGEGLYRAYFLWNAHEDWYQPGSGALLFGMRLLDWLLLALAVVGAVAALTRAGPARGIAAFLLAFTALNAVHHVEARYAMPLRGLYLTLAALGFLTALSQIRRRSPVP